jgi:hypothetical protein
MDRRRLDAARRHNRPEKSAAKPRGADVLLPPRRKVAEAVKEPGIQEVTYYR